MDFGPNSDEEHEKQSKLCNISAVEQEPLSDYLDRDVLFLIRGGHDHTAFSATG